MFDKTITLMPDEIITEIDLRGQQRTVSVHYEETIADPRVIDVRIPGESIKEELSQVELKEIKHQIIKKLSQRPFSEYADKMLRHVKPEIK